MSPPATLIAHVLFKIKTSLLKWKIVVDWTDAQVEDVAQTFVDKLCCDAETGNNNKAFMETGIKLSRALDALEDKGAWSPQSFLTTRIADILANYDAYLSVNHTVFEQITAHHTNIVTEKWSDVAADGSSLAVYSEAANAMGAKVWVAECNKWFETFSVGYFRNGGARRHYLKATRTAEQSGAEPATPDCLAKDLMILPAEHARSCASAASAATSPSASAGAGQRIRVLDVGSCYNPIARSEQAGLFDVTALDLYPVHPSVLQCDFLNLLVGAAGSDPVVGDSDSVNPFSGVYADIEDSSAGVCDRQGEDSTTEQPVKKARRIGETQACSDTASAAVSPAPPSMVPSSSSQRLWRLPSASYDVVTMSLVLSYLPTSAQRLCMVRQARALLVSPPARTSPSTSTSGCCGGQTQPHRNGLLLIAEKQSIFKPPFKLGEHPQRSKKTTVKQVPLDAHECLSQKGADVTGREVNYWQAWVDAICACGFELVKYHYFPSSDGRKSHLFAFGTVAASVGAIVQGSTDSTADTFAGVKPEMWIKQDHERASTSASSVC